jgi:multidrug efflux pump subunit AcrB
VRGIIAWFARNHVAANLLMFLIIAGGLFALPQIQQKSFPDIDIDVIRVTVPYLGAAPEEVEEGVCVRIEEEIQGINGIEKLSSTAAEGACTVAAELMAGYDTDRALSEIKNAVDAITTFPDEAEKPVVAQVTVKRVVTQLALSGAVDERTLKIYGQRIRDEISALPGITQVELSNARSYEISIEVSEESLRRHHPPWTCRAARSRRVGARSCCAPRGRPTWGATSRTSSCSPTPTEPACTSGRSPPWSTASRTTTAGRASTAGPRS